MFSFLGEGRNRPLGQCCNLFMLYLHVLITSQAHWKNMPVAALLQINITFCVAHFMTL